MLDAEESFQSPTPRKARPSSPQRQVVARDLEPDHNPARDWPERDVFALTGRRTEAQNLGPRNTGQNCLRRLLGRQN